MKPPLDTKIYHDDIAVYWLENEILLCSICKPTTLTIELLKKSYSLIDEITNGRKVCLLTDTSLAGSSSANTREYSINASANCFKAMAMISKASYSSLLVNTFMTFSTQLVPMKIFTNEEEARIWIKNYF